MRGSIANDASTRKPWKKTCAGYCDGKPYGLKDNEDSSEVASEDFVDAAALRFLRKSENLGGAAATFLMAARRLAMVVVFNSHSPAETRSVTCTARRTASWPWVDV